MVSCDVGFGGGGISQYRTEGAEEFRYEEERKEKEKKRTQEEKRTEDNNTLKALILYKGKGGLHEQNTSDL